MGFTTKSHMRMEVCRILGISINVSLHQFLTYFLMTLGLSKGKKPICICGKYLSINMVLNQLLAGMDDKWLK